ncbi:MAG: 6-phosphogluconate dehydrogenase, decarboxylating [candidate division TM6 bacterium GW2011_GWF2_38_10]|nr:MAG: 6-phosphogluconate dehydrogenase, decarboxylating [candidate division TM6 bacterium GW2011_GWF2_38_10]
MNIGIVGLGRMGQAITWRLLQHNIQPFGYDPNEQSRQDFAALGGIPTTSLSSLAQKASIIWVMVPAGKPVDDVIEQLLTTLPPQAIIIDGGNSHYQDSKRRAAQLAARTINFIDCGTSGGIHGRENGFSLMIGGDATIVQQLDPLFKALATPQGYGHFGPAGAGHYVKMIHNGVEYALLQAYAEGFHLLHNGSYDNIDLEKVCSVWAHGSVVRSWIVELAQNIFKEDQTLETVSGFIDENKTGQWTQEEAALHNIPVKTIELALQTRAWSRQTGGNYATKIVALLRNQFGGHAVKSTK